MGVIDTRTFKSGNSIAVRLPRELGYAENEAIRIENDGKVLTIRPAIDAAAARRKVEAFVARRRARTPIGEIGERLPFDWPTRAE